MSKFVLAVYVDNRVSVLTRITSMLTRRGFNIDTVTAGETERPEYTRITISISGDGYTRQQLLSQLRKLYNVKKVEVLEDGLSITRELMLIKVKNCTETLHDVRSAVDIYRAKIIDYSNEAMCIEITGETSKLNAFIDVMKPFGIIEICRTGLVALERGKTSFFDSE